LISRISSQKQLQTSHRPCPGRDSSGSEVSLSLLWAFEIGFDWLCFLRLRGPIYCHNLLSHKTLRNFMPAQIGFVFSNSFSQYASRSTQYEQNWLCFFKLCSIKSACLGFRAQRFGFPAEGRRLALFFQIAISKNRRFYSHFCLFTSIFSILNSQL
jgi:hypothetical protein